MSTQQMQALLNSLRQAGIRNESVLNAMAFVPRERFIDEALAHQAYDNAALPIGASQTISQPYIVAKMTELLMLRPESRVLEIGTGSGYQTAVLAHLVDQVCSVERIKSLQWQAKRRLKQLDLHNVATRHGDGWEGWPARAPFDAIIVTAAASTVPHALLQQLADNGYLVIPVGDGKENQILKRIQRKNERFIEEIIEPVRFVPLIQGELA